MLLSFYHTCASEQHHVLHIESLLSYQFHILVGIFIIELGLYIPMMGFLKMPQVFVSKQVGCTPTQFQFELSYTYSSSASVAWQSLLLALTSIDRHLHSLLISRVDVRLSPFLSSSTQPPPSYSIPPIVICPWLTLMYCVKVERALERQKYETISWLVIGVVHDLNTLCWEDGSQPDYMILQG